MNILPHLSLSLCTFGKLLEDDWKEVKPSFDISTNVFIYPFPFRTIWISDACMYAMCVSYVISKQPWKWKKEMGQMELSLHRSCVCPDINPSSGMDVYLYQEYGSLCQLPCWDKSHNRTQTILLPSAQNYRNLT